MSDTIESWKVLAEIAQDEEVSSKDFDAICDAFPALVGEVDARDKQIERLEVGFMAASEAQFAAEREVAALREREARLIEANLEAQRIADRHMQAAADLRERAEQHAAECSTLREALRKIARPGDRTTDVAQVIAQDALARLDGTDG